MPRRESQCQHHLAPVGAGTRATIRAQMEYKTKRVRAITQIKMIRLDKVMVVDGGEHGVGCWVLGRGAVWKVVP